MRKPVSGFPTRSDTNRAVQSHKMARALKFRIQEVEGLYNLCSENKGADQLRGYCEADLRLCLRISKKPVFSRRDSFHICGLDSLVLQSKQRKPNTLISLHDSAAHLCLWFFAYDKKSFLVKLGLQNKLKNNTFFSLFVCPMSLLAL